MEEEEEEQEERSASESGSLDKESSDWEERGGRMRKRGGWVSGWEKGST